MAPATFRIDGTVLDRATHSGVPGARVEAWDRDVKYHSLLGVAQTDAQGRFRITFDESYFGDYGGDKLPDLYLKVFLDDHLVKSTEDQVRRNLPAGDTSLQVEVEVPPVHPSTGLSDTTGSGDTPPIIDPGPLPTNGDDGSDRPPLDTDGDPTPAPVPASSGSSMEVALHELGESIAATVASVQRELARYPNALGAFVLDEMDLTIPVRMRVDLLGQVRATVADEDQAGVLVGNLHLRLKPVLGAAQPPPVTSGQSLQSLNVLRPEVIARLEQERIFTVDDLLRVSNTATGRTALNKMQLGTDLSSVLDRASVLTLPSVPAPVAENLVDIGISKPSDFVQGDPVQIAHTLSERLKQPITPEAVQAWQKEVGDLISVPLPRPRPDMEQ